MNLQDYVFLNGQTEHGRTLSDDVHLVADPDVIAIKNDLRLVALAKTEQRSDNSSAKKAIEILLDDMEYNMPSVVQGMGRGSMESASALCLRESVNNINEYLFGLYQQNGVPEQGVSLAVVQFEGNQFSSIVGEGYSILLDREGSLRHLTQGLQPSDLLGQQIDFNPTIVEQNIKQGDLIIIIDSQALQSVTQDFLRISLTRFKNQPQMLIRQINTRAHRNGMPKKPVLLMAEVAKSPEPQKSWLKSMQSR